MMLAASVAPEQTFTSLADLIEANGSNPYYVSLVQARNSNLRGTTAGKRSCRSAARISGSALALARRNHRCLRSIFRRQ